jgi:hypothetical protein
MSSATAIRSPTRTFSPALPELARRGSRAVALAGLCASAIFLQAAMVPICGKAPGIDNSYV